MHIIYTCTCTSNEHVHVITYTYIYIYLYTCRALMSDVVSDTLCNFVHQQNVPIHHMLGRNLHVESGMYNKHTCMYTCIAAKRYMYTYLYVYILYICTINFSDLPLLVAIDI